MRSKGSRPTQDAWPARPSRLAARVALLLVALTFPALAAAIELPPVYAPPGDQHHVGKVILMELVTPDIEKSRNFYAGLFGWSYRDVGIHGARLCVATSHGRTVGALYQPPAGQGGKGQASWLTFLAVRDVDATVRAALAARGKVLVAPASYHGRGRQAVLSDPEGASFAVLASDSGDGEDDLAMSGEWIWNSLLVPDADADTAFYQSLFSYEVYDLAAEDGREHVILASDEVARASVNSLPGDFSRRHPHWLGFVRVDDVGLAASRSVELGGKVLVPAHPDRHGGLVAVLSDPSGAPFGLMEYPPTDPGEKSP